MICLTVDYRSCEASKLVFVGAKTRVGVRKEYK